MANAWIIAPLPVTVAAPFGTSIGAPSNLANDYMGVIWGAAGSLMSATGDGRFYHLLDVDLGGDQVVDTIIALGAISLPAGTTVTVQVATQAQGPFTGAFWSSLPAPGYAGSVPLPSGELTFQWNSPDYGTPPAPARYWRLVIVAMTRFYLQLRRIIVGRRFVPLRNFGYGGAFGVRDLGSMDYSRRGVPLPSSGARLRTVGLTFSSLSRDEVEYVVQPLLESLGNTRTVALVTNPAREAMLSRRTYFGTLTGDLGAVQRRADAYQAAINLVSRV